MPPLTPQQFRDAIVANRLGLRPVSGGFVATAKGGTLLQSERDAKPTPEEAIEDAIARLQEQDGKRKRVRAFEAMKAVAGRRWSLFAIVSNQGTPEEAWSWETRTPDGTILATAESPVLAIEAALTSEGLRP